MLIELRGDGQQTVFPGSIHTSGEAIEWGEDDHPATAEYAVLAKAVKNLAALCLILRYLPAVRDWESLRTALNEAEPRLAKDATIATFGKDGRIKATALFARIENLAREHNAGCIIFDSVADFFGGNENERREVRAFVGLLRGLGMSLDAAVVFLAHPSVDGIKTGRGYSGSTHWNNAVRSRLYFSDGAKAKEEAGAPPNPDLRVIELAKSNRARRGEKIHVMWTEGRFVELSTETAQSLGDEKDAEEMFLKLLWKLNKQGVHASPYRSPSFAPTIFAKQSGNKGFGKVAFECAMYRLLDKGRIRAEPHGPPSKRRHRLVVEASAERDLA